jgi:hypothetical protein
MEKYCVNCVHCLATPSRWYYCTKATPVNLVTGKKHEYKVFCAQEREETGSCKKEALYFEEKRTP